MKSTNPSKKSVDYTEVIRPYLKMWKWFAISLGISILLGILKIRYTTPAYAVMGKIQILDENTTASELDAFRDLQGFSARGGYNVQDEIEVLNSRSNMIQVVKDLGLNVRTLSLGKIHSSELYGKKPFNLNFIASDTIIYNALTSFFITIKSDNNLDFLEGEEDQNTKEQYSFGEKISTSVGDIVITPNMVDSKRYVDKKYKVIVEPLYLVAEKYQTDILITVTDELSNIITLSLNDPLPERAKDVINGLIDNYNSSAINDKKLIADKTSKFINERIVDIYSDLSSVEQRAETFKTDRGVTDIASQANLNLNVGAASQQELEAASTQFDIATSMKAYIDGQEGYEVLPADIGLDNPSLSGTVSRYNELILERNRLLESSNEKNPTIVNLDQQIQGLKRSMQSSLNSMTNNLGLRINNLSSQVSKIKSRIYAAPGYERALRDINRKQETTESLYLYLLQKREESQITYASATPKSKIIDRAYLSSTIPVSPRKSIILLASLIFGFLIPFSIIYVKDLLNNRVNNKVELEKIVGSIPVLAEVPRLSKKESKFIIEHDRSVLAESLRILRTNLDYLLQTKKKNTNKQNTIFVTSSTPGEGKTFISSNLAMILANTKKRVLLVGGDIRNPKIHNFFAEEMEGESAQEKKKFGLTDFLASDSIEVKEIINTERINGNIIDVIYSGQIPPNPAELLMSDRVGVLFEEITTKYDYVIVDTAPVINVADTMLLSKQAGLILYVTNAGKTEKKILEYPLRLAKEGKLPNLAFLVNSVKATDLGYGGKYSYGYGEKENKWWKFSWLG